MNNYLSLMRAGNNKYRNKITTYGGETYHSKKEADYAQSLDMLQKGKVITKWERQIPYPFFINDVKVGSYILDFKVHYADGHIEHIDVKGMKKGPAYSMFKFKKKLMKALYDIDVIEV